jgi:hypothetical protein
VRVGFPAFAIALLVLSGCDLTGETSQPQSPNFEVTNDLESRITDLSGGTRSTAARVTATAESDFSVSGVARVEPPEVKGTRTKASHLSFNDEGDDRVFVGYKIRGKSYGGGIDVLDAKNPKNPKSTNSLETDNLDVQEVIDDPDAGAEYVAGALETKKKNRSPAALTKLSLSGGNGISVDHKRLSGNVAKSVVNAPSGDSQHDLYVVTDGNALYRYDSSLGNELEQTVSDDAEFSSITAHQDLLIMLTQSGALWKSDFSSPSDPWEGDLTLEKSEIRPLGIARLTASDHEDSSDNFVFAALNTGGFRVLNDDASEELFGRTEGDYTSVSATDESNYLYASRTDGTVEVYEFDGNNSPSWSSDPIATINTANYEDGSSNVQSNQVLAVGDYLYIANGSEGTLVLEVDE